LLGLALLAFQAGRLEESAERLRDAAQAAPDDPEPTRRLAFVLAQRERFSEAAEALEQWLAGHPPGTPELYLQCGSLHQHADEVQAARLAFQRAYLLRPDLESLAEDPALPEEFRTQLGHAMLAMRGLHGSMRERVLEEIGNDFPGGPLERLEAALAHLSGSAPARHERAGQRSRSVHMPGLEARPWHQASEFSWYAAARGLWPEIARECRALGDGWQARPFYDERGERYEDVWAACPATARLLDEIEPVELPPLRPAPLFSRLPAGTRAGPAFGFTNTCLIAHLVIDANDADRLTVGGEARAWVPGELLVFDETFAHSVSVTGPRDRIVLSLELWHPGVRAHEKAGLSRYFGLRRDWLTRARSGLETDPTPDRAPGSERDVAAAADGPRTPNGTK